LSSPTQRTLAALRADGWVAQVVEHWNAFARIRQDLWGCIDVLAMREGRILGVQATSGTNVQARMKKSMAEPRLKIWLSAGGEFEVWGWRKVGKKGKRKTWQVRREIIVEEML